MARSILCRQAPSRASTLKSIGDVLGEPPANVVTDDIASKGIPIGGQTNLFGVGDFPVLVALELPERILDSLP